MLVKLTMLENVKFYKNILIILFFLFSFNLHANEKNKILVSNGKSLVIKTKVGYYRYQLKKTPLNLILDKKFLINKINTLEERIVNDSFINYTIKENDQEINIFFNNKTLNLIGWQTKDIYQNLTITFISSVKRNEVFDKNIFKIPIPN